MYTYKSAHTTHIYVHAYVYVFTYTDHLVLSSAYMFRADCLGFGNLSGGSFLEKTDSLSLSHTPSPPCSHRLSVALHLGAGLFDVYLIHDGISSGGVTTLVLFK